MISLTQLRTFLAVAEAGSVGAAAERLAVSQPAVSAALSSLGQSVNAPLVERDGRGTRLTEAGETLAIYARRIFALLDEASAETAHAARRETRRVRLAAVTTVAEHLIAALLNGFRIQEPEMAVELYVGNRDQVWERLRHWEADLAVGGRPPRDPAFVTLAVRSNELVVVRAPSLPDEYLQATWLVREPGSGTRAATEAFFATLGIDPPTLTIGSNAAIRACVRAGLGISLLSRGSVEQELETRELIVIPTPGTPLARNWHLVGPLDRELPAAAARFVSYALESRVFESPSG
jgi:DNA-binding transcriptional LysR family regulator